MPIRGRSLGEVSRFFVDHLNTLLHATITQTPLSLELRRDRNVANVRFRSGVQSSTAALKTRYGPMGLYIGQLCDSVVGDDRLHTLRTTSYRYALVPTGHGQPLLRWEYVRFPGTTALHCRHHFQGPIRLDIADSDGTPAMLNDWHLPTGWVTVEEVLRFCIVDLAVTPLSDDWDAILQESYVRFKTEFTSLGEA
jgi:hypothetical protein